ncbi:cytochrome b-245 chaperone 1 isoform X1 [Hippopotamus amphibius kiboko]|uniref:cytochrome b-245 chaperone 1 isoform X1 n=1 Tax=Hippopotamus amphibius kiboko TaxID=575201 RepID=UPI002596C77C|nr:cytochrome b-245 chaperone 1 isoform X1 [Hippopotamus amphibius kiboko]
MCPVNTVSGTEHSSEQTSWLFPPLLSLVVFLPPAPCPQSSLAMGRGCLPGSVGPGRRWALGWWWPVGKYPLSPHRNLVDWSGCRLLQWSLGWKLFYVTGCLFVAVQNLEDWEEAVFNKNTGKVVLKTFSLYRKLLTLCRAGHDQVVVLLSDIRDVNVEEEKVRYFGKGYVVVLRFATGFSHPLTQSAVMGHRSDVEAIAKLITAFLELHRLESPVELSQSSDSEAEGPGNQS